MSDSIQTKEFNFCQEDVANVLREIIDCYLQSNNYIVDEIPLWNKSIIQKCLEHLISMDKPFKYIVNCTIIDKQCAGLHSYSSGYWENLLDGYVTVKWENRYLFCVVNAYAVSL